jgi:exopolyphosphatase/guanosine-5'-triphosphate,3'-diphosphate pyrophosphatase
MKPDLFEQEVESLLARHESEPEHTRHVAFLAGLVFDGLRERHRLGADEACILRGAALLHDIGWSRTQPDGRGHHKVSAAMIREHSWRSISDREITLLAAVARYHRRALPESGHAEWEDLAPEDHTRMLLMAACLRLADGLDRRHLQLVSSLEAEFPEGNCRIRVRSAVEVEQEIEAGRKKSDLLSRIVGTAVEVLRMR